MSLEPPAPPPQTPYQPMQSVAFPKPVEILRGLAAPLIGFAVTFGVAIVMVVLIAIAASLDSDGDSGVDSSTIHAIGVLLGMPFQLVSMALLGNLHINDEGGVSTAFFAPPLALTAIYLYVTARVSRRRVPAPDTMTRSMLSIAIGLVMAAVVTPIAWGAAMREDGTTMHAASVSLFFGVWGLTGLAVFAGSRQGAGLPRPAWISVEYAEGIRLWLHQVVFWIAVAAPILVIAGFEQGLWFVLLIPLWLITVGLDTFALGHLASIGAFGEGVHAWDFAFGWAILMLAGAAFLVLLTSTTWHLRRDQRSEWLADPLSWLVLPAIWLGGGVLVWLVPRLVASGGYGELSASVGIGPSPLVIVFLPLFGLAIEGLSRTLGPVLAGALPAGLVARLRGTPVAPAAGVPADGVAGAAPAPRPPLTDAERKQWKRIGLGLGAAVVLIGGAAITISAINSAKYSAEATAESYLDALVEANLADVVELAPVDGSAGDELLTDEVYNAAEAKITGYEIKETETFGDITSVTVELEGLGEDAVETELSLKQNGKTGVFFDNWEVADGGLAKQVTLDLPEGSTGISINGTTTEADEDGDYWLLPGTYLFNPFEGNPWLSASGDGATVVEADSYGGYVEIPEAEPSEALRTTVDEQLAAFLAPCMAAKTVEPDGCPNDGYALGDGTRKVVWTLTRSPEVDYSSFDGSFPADLSVDSGEAALSYEYDASYGFGPKAWTKQEDTSSLYLNVTLSLVDDQVVAEFSAY